MTSESPSPMNETPATPRRNNWLIASVALNTFLLGGIASALLIGPHRSPPQRVMDRVIDGRPPMLGPGRGPGIALFAEGLSPAGRDTLLAQRAAEEAALTGHLAALRAARDAMDRAFVAEPFDRAAFDAAFGEMRAAESAMSASMRDRVSALAAALSPEDRKAFAQNLRRLPMGPPGGPPALPDRR